VATLRSTIEMLAETADCRIDASLERRLVSSPVLRSSKNATS
jgi:hypothetical protein